MPYIIGIDPGVSGGLAVVDCATGRLLSARKWEGVDAFNQFVGGCTPASDYAVYLEQVGYMPGDGGRGNWTFAEQYGVVQGILLAHQIPVFLVRPVAWQKGLGLPKAPNKTKHKNNLKDTAARLFPYVKKFTHATADAALIARHGYLRRFDHFPQLSRPA